MNGSNDAEEASASVTTMGQIPAAAAIHQVIAEQTEAWNRGDAHAWARGFSDTAGFVNILGMALNGRAEIEARHALILSTLFRGSHAVATVNRITFLGREIALAETVNHVTGCRALPTGIMATNSSGALLTRMTYVLQHSATHGWEIVHAHNTATAPDAPELNVVAHVE